MLDNPASLIAEVSPKNNAPNDPSNSRNNINKNIPYNTLSLITFFVFIINSLYSNEKQLYLPFYYYIAS